MCILALDFIRFERLQQDGQIFQSQVGTGQYIFKFAADFILMGLHGKLMVSALPKLQSTLYLAYSN